MKKLTSYFLQPFKGNISKTYTINVILWTCLLGFLLVLPKAVFAEFAEEDYNPDPGQSVSQSIHQRLPIHALRNITNDASPCGAKRMIIRLKRRPTKFLKRIAAGGEPPDAIARLKKDANASQSDLIHYLNRRKDNFRKPYRFQKTSNAQEAPQTIKETRSFWLSNCIVTTATDEEIKEIATHPDVEEIFENVILSIPTMDVGESSPSPVHDYPWNHKAIGLSELSGYGLDGHGVRLGYIDTGIDPQHPYLAGKITNWAEFDFYGKKIDSSPHDSHKQEHGTHVACVLAGDTIGIAPGATLSVALALPNGYGSLEQILSAMQWILNPDENDDTDDGAQIVNMSWGMWGDYPLLREAVLNMIEAGVLPVCAIGNTGELTTLSPGNVPEAIGVGALDQTDEVPWFSAGDEVYWDGNPLFKPDLSAPGVEVPGMDSLGNALSLSGTSFAAPHIAGAGALLLQHTPDLTLEQLKGFLLHTATDLGDPGHDIRYGKGRLNISLAIDFLERYQSRFNTSDLVLETINPLDNGSSLTFQQYFSDGEGGLSGPVPHKVALGSGLTPLGLADVNGDGYSDLVVKSTEAIADGDFQISYNVYPSVEASGFSKNAYTWYSFNSKTKDPYTFIGLGDVTGDKKADMVIAQDTLQSNSYYQWDISVIPSPQRTASESVPEIWSTFTAYKIYCVEFSLGDIDGDHKTDLIIGKRYKYYNKPIYCYSSPSNGTSFNAKMSYPTQITASFYGPLKLMKSGDVNGDGLDDLILRADMFNPRISTPVYVSLSNGPGTFKHETQWAALPLQTGGRLESLSDMDGDGLTDLIVRNSESNPTLRVWHSNGQTQFLRARADLLNQDVIKPDTDIGFIGAANVGMGDWK